MADSTLTRVKLPMKALRPAMHVKPMTMIPVRNVSLRNLHVAVKPRTTLKIKPALRCSTADSAPHIQLQAAGKSGTEVVRLVKAARRLVSPVGKQATHRGSTRPDEKCDEFEGEDGMVIFSEDLSVNELLLRCVEDNVVLSESWCRSKEAAPRKRSREADQEGDGSLQRRVGRAVVCPTKYFGKTFEVVTATVTKVSH